MSENDRDNIWLFALTKEIILNLVYPGFGFCNFFLIVDFKVIGNDFIHHEHITIILKQ